MAAALERGFGIDPSPKLVAALKDAMRDPEILRFIHAGRRRLSREHREKISKSKKGGNPGPRAAATRRCRRSPR